MVTPELLQYIKENLAMGKTREQIQQGLVLSGEWKPSDIEETYATIDVSQKASAYHHSAFMVTVLIVLLVAGGAYGAERWYGPTINATVMNMSSLMHRTAVPSPVMMPAMQAPPPSTSNVTAPIVVKVVNGNGFTFMAPADWNDSSAVGDGCPEESIVNSDQTFDAQGNPQGNPGQIDVWQKNCIPSELTYKNQTEKNGFLISTTFDQDTPKQVAETQNAYRLVIDTFKLVP